MEKKDTAVEWLINQLSSSKYIYHLMEEIECQSTIVQPNIFEQAKAMEKEQIVEAYREGYAGYSPTDYYHENYNK